MPAGLSKFAPFTSHPLEVREKARQLYQRQGLSCSAIASEMQLPVGTVRGWRRREKWKATQSTVAQAARAAAQESAQQVARTHADDCAGFIRRTIEDCNEFRAKILDLLQKGNLLPGQADQLSSAYSRIVGLTRQAYGLDSQASGPQTLVQISLNGSNVEKPIGKAVVSEPIDA